MKFIPSRTDIKVGDEVVLTKDIIFDYGGMKNGTYVADLHTVARCDEVFSIDNIDKEGYWIKENSIYIEHGFEDEYFEVLF